ncbi:MAG: ATP-binding protein [Pseudonocardiaceae bacterium]
MTEPASADCTDNKLATGREQPPEGGTRNALSGNADNVVQAREIQGGVHVHQPRASSLPVPRQLPADVAFFTGRDAELGRLDALLDGGEPAAVVISAIAGTGGMGKTSLAVHWAHRVRERFPEGELYVNLRGYDPGPPVTPEQALDGFLRALDVPAEKIPHDVDAQAGLYRSLLAGRRMVVVLDNAATPDQVRPLLPGSPTCAVVVTSRSRLSGLVARDGAHRLTLDVLPPEDAVMLLRCAVGPDRVDAEPEAAAEVARHCDYLPLALRIAAERAAARSYVRLADLAEELAVEHDRLDVLTADDDEITGVRTVFSWSYRTLAPEAARVFRLLGRHPGPDVGVASAAALTGNTTTSVRRQLAALTSAHLLTETRRDRYQFHDLLRAYATERAALDEFPDDCANATHRVLAWYLHTAHAALYVLYPQHPEIPLDPLTVTCQPLTFTHRDQALQWFDAEHANLMAAIRLATDTGQHTIAWQLPNAMDAFLGWRYHWADRITVHQLGLAAAVHINNQLGERWALGHLNEAYLEIERFEEALPLALRGLSVAREIGDRWAEGNSLLSLGKVHLHFGRFGEAADHYRRALTIYREVNHRRNESSAMINLAELARAQQHFEQAIVYARDCQAIAREINDTRGEADTLYIFGLIYLDLRRWHEATDHFQQALAIYRELSDRHAAARTLRYLGETLRGMGQLTEARESWLEALSIFDDLGAPEATQVRACLETLDAHNADQHR